MDIIERRCPIGHELLVVGDRFELCMVTLYKLVYHHCCKNGEGNIVLEVKLQRRVTSTDFLLPRGDLCSRSGNIICWDCVMYRHNYTIISLLYTLTHVNRFDYANVSNTLCTRGVSYAHIASVLSNCLAGNTL